MKNDLISRSAIDFGNCHDTPVGTKMLVDLNEISDAIKILPSVDAVPVVHGRWVFNPDEYTWDCTNCKGGVGSGTRIGKYNFCPYCGAKMTERKILNDD